jgi:hypothetical protein
MSKDNDERKPFRVLQRDELLALAKKPSQGTATAIVVSTDETSWKSELLNNDTPLPSNAGDWSIQSSVMFVEPMAHRFPLDKVAQSEGNDLLYVELVGDERVARGGGTLTIDPSRKDTFEVDSVPIKPKVILLKGQVCVVLVEGDDRPQLAHVSNIDSVACHFVTLSPVDMRTASGQRIAGINCTRLPPLLLHMLAQREQPTPNQPQKIHRMPLPNASLLPNTPTSGANKRRKRCDKSFEYIVKMGERQARRVAVAVIVKLDDESMRLAALSHTKKKTEKRDAAIQLQLPYPKEATTDAEIQEAVQGQLQHFDTDYLLSFDAITALLGTAPDESTGFAIDEVLQRKVVAMRFGSTDAASTEQRQRIRKHFETLMQVCIVVAPQNDTKAFRGSILLRAGEVVDTGDGSVEPLKVGDVVVLNPILYRDIVHKGKGMFVDARYFQLNPYQQDWHLRIYRYLAARWSANSTKLVGKDWKLEIKLHTLLDMSGIDWRTQAVSQDRGKAQTRRRVETTLESLRTEGMIGAWHIDGDGLADAAKLTVEVPEAIRKKIERCRPGLHADARSGALQARGKVKPKAIRKAR